MGRLKQSTEKIQELLDKVESGEVAPDWNASEGEAGHIKGRSHYIDGAHAIPFEQWDKRFDEDGNAIYSLVLGYGVDYYSGCLIQESPDGSHEENYIFFGTEWKSLHPAATADIRINYDSESGDSVLEIKLYRYGDQEGTVVTLINNALFAYGRGDDFIYPIANEFIPDTIARTNDVDELREETTSLWENLDHGTFPDLVAGDLAGRGESVPAEFGFRASGGKSIKDGRAYIKRIKGNSLVWNNMIDTRDRQGDGGYVYENDYLHLVEGHKYAMIREKANDGFYCIPVINGSEIYDYSLRNGELAKIFTSAYTTTPSTTRMYCEQNVGKTILCDLTQMFQAGNEPTTIEEFNARVATLGVDLYAYNEGEVIHCNTESIKSVGDNALNADRSLVFDFDGSYGNYDFINTEGAFVGISADGYIKQGAIDYAEKIEGGFRLHNNAGGYGIGLFVKALPNEEYSVSYASDNGRITFGFYDKGKNLISYELWGNRFTTPSSCEYIMLCLRDNKVINVDISFTDIMLTLVHSGWPLDTDAGYRPYWEDTLPLPIIRKYFPQGMKSAGSAHDEIRFNKASGKWEAVQRIGSVDMGTLDWYNDASLGGFYSDILVGAKKLFDGICAKYPFVGDYRNVTDKTCGYVYESCVLVKDSSYTDAASFKADMAGVILYYESNDWEWVELDEADQNFRDYYNVADFGTEQSQSSVPSAPFSADIIYQFNAVDMIREHEAEITELQSIIAAMQAQLTSLINGGQ